MIDDGRVVYQKRETPCIGENGCYVKLKEDQVREIRRRYELGESSYKISMSYTFVSYAAVRNVCQGRSWKHVK
jgi:hypothetical protein